MSLPHVLWIGGPPDAGKTTVANMLAEKYGLGVYHFDRHEPARDARMRLEPTRYPNAATWDAMALDELWVTNSPEAMARLVIGCWSERISLVVGDLLAMPVDRPVVAEGPGFFPQVILPLLSNPRQAIWLVPSEAFKRASHERRGKSSSWQETSDPESAHHNHVERDLLLAEHYTREARERGLPLIVVDGARSAEEVATEVEGHFGPLLEGRA